MSFDSTLSIALSRARPIKNSSDRSAKCQLPKRLSRTRHLTVYALLISKRLALLSLVPVQDQTVPERQGSSTICSPLIAVEQRARKCSLNVSDGLLVELVWCGERLRHLLTYQYVPHIVWSYPAIRVLGGSTYELPPCFTLGLWDAVLDSLDLTGAETGHRPLVLGAGEVGWPNGTLEISERCTCRRTALARRRVSGRHLEDVNCREGRIAKRVSVSHRRGRG